MLLLFHCFLTKN